MQDLIQVGDYVVFRHTENDDTYLGGNIESVSDHSTLVKTHLGTYSVLQEDLFLLIKPKTLGKLYKENETLGKLIKENE